MLKFWLLILVLVAFMFAGRTSSSAPATESYTEESYTEEGYAEEETSEAYATDQNSIFSEMPSQFSFLSGAGGWSTELTINADGSFSGSYHDSDMGSSGEDYDATIYVCNFEGQFSVAEQVDDYTYRLKIDWMTQNETEGESWIEDRVQYIASIPYGLENAEDIMLYLPGRTTSDLTEDCISWIFMAEGWSYDTPGETLSHYVLYNVNAGEAFTSNDW